MGRRPGLGRAVQSTCGFGLLGRVQCLLVAVVSSEPVRAVVQSLTRVALLLMGRSSCEDWHLGSLVPYLASFDPEVVVHPAVEHLPYV